MANKRFWLGMLVMVLAFGMTVFGCGDGASNNDDDDDDDEHYIQTPLTGTVTVTSNIAVSSGVETMTLTADTSGLNGDSLYYFRQWMRDGVNISGARSSTYQVTEADYGKNLRVQVTSSVLSGEQFGDFTVPTPTTLNLTLKWANDAGKKDTYIVIEKQDGTYWKSAPSSEANLTTTGTTVTLASWNETKFKMRTSYTFIDLKYYFKKDNADGSELFDLTNGTKTYTLTNKYATSVMYDLFATEG